MAVVLGPDRVPDAHQVARVGRAVAEEVDHVDRAERPPASEADAPPDRGVIGTRVRVVRIEHHERDARPGRPPAAQAVAITPARIEDGGAAHVPTVPRGLRCARAVGKGSGLAGFWRALVRERVPALVAVSAAVLLVGALAV